MYVSYIINTMILVSFSRATPPFQVTMWHSDTLQTQRRDWRFVTGSVPCPSNITVDGDAPLT